MGINRRQFLQNSSAFLSACAMGTGLSAVSEALQAQANKSRIELLGSYWTFSGSAIPHSDREYSFFDFRDRVEALAKRGFTGMGIWHADLAHILETRSLKEMKQILDDNGIRHVELEFINDWFVEGEARGQSDKTRALLLEAAETLSARHIKVGDFEGKTTPMPVLIESFAKLCADAANAGTRVVFELMPISMINTLADTLTMLEGANAANGGVILDTWHVFKIGIPFAEIARIPLRFLLGVELNDGYLKTPEGMTIQEETTGHRQFCGEGEFDLKGFLAALARTGYDGPYGIEILNLNLRTWPLDRAVEHAFTTTLAQFSG
jgi:sugar phosphate isomerase/epimerase